MAKVLQRDHLKIKSDHIFNDWPQSERGLNISVQYGEHAGISTVFITLDELAWINDQVNNFELTWDAPKPYVEAEYEDE